MTSWPDGLKWLQVCLAGAETGNRAVVEDAEWSLGQAGFGLLGAFHGGDIQPIFREYSSQDPGLSL